MPHLFTLLLAAAPPESPSTPTWSAIEPSSPNVTRVVFALMRGDGATAFSERNKCLRRAMTGAAPYDQIVFFEGGGDVEQAMLQAETPGLRFIDVSSAFQVPSHVTMPPEVLRGEVEGSLGYRHMVHAHSNCSDASSHTHTHSIAHSPADSTTGCLPVKRSATSCR